MPALDMKTLQQRGHSVADSASGDQVLAAEKEDGGVGVTSPILSANSGGSMCTFSAMASLLRMSDTSFLRSSCSCWRVSTLAWAWHVASSNSLVRLSTCCLTLASSACIFSPSASMTCETAAMTAALRLPALAEYCSVKSVGKSSRVTTTGSGAGAPALSLPSAFSPLRFFFCSKETAQASLTDRGSTSSSLDASNLAASVSKPRSRSS